jgi:hypothetical protein
MRIFRLLTVLAIVIAVAFAGGVVFAADGGRAGGGHSGGSHQGGGHSGGHGGSGHSGGGHGSWGHHGGSRFDFDFVVGGPFWGWPWYYPYGYPGYYPYYYQGYYPYYYAPAEQSMPQEYVERPRGRPSSRPSGVWYYCPRSNAYYPYVRECPGGWQKVPVKPASESER